MSQKLKVVVTRNLIDEAQQILEAEPSLEIVQWKSDGVC
jgi:glyoxylate/hydroxypyruvate reductase